LQQQQQQQQHDDEGDAAFAFRNSCPTRRIRESCEEQHMKSMERDHHDSQAQMLYLDMDAALPLHWESMINTSCRSRRHSYSSSSSSSSSSSREFEFHMQQVQIRPEVVAGAEDAAAGDHHLHVGRDVVQGISHADELFYKGQLLPLHLRPRQQMVEKLTSEYSHVNQQEKAAATVAAAASDDDHAAALLDSSSYVKFCVNSYTDDLHVAAAAATGSLPPLKTAAHETPMAVHRMRAASSTAATTTTSCSCWRRSSLRQTWAPWAPSHRL
jgi:hypothetical protein